MNRTGKETVDMEKKLFPHRHPVHSDCRDFSECFILTAEMSPTSWSICLNLHTLNSHSYDSSGDYTRWESSWKKRFSVQELFIVLFLVFRFGPSLNQTKINSSEISI